MKRTLETLAFLGLCTLFGCVALGFCGFFG